jgi:membrane protein
MSSRVLAQRLRSRFQSLQHAARVRIDSIRESDGPFGVLYAYYERDRDVHAPVLGSAIALRLFLFMIPCILTVVGLANVLHLQEVLGDLLDAARTESSVAEDVLDAASTSGRGGFGLALSGIVLVLWTGRSLATVLTACSLGAWRMPARQPRPKARMLVALVGLMFAIVVGTILMGRIRAFGGLALTTASIVATVALYSAAWFAISLILPRATNDPGAQLPGAALVGIGLSLLQLTVSLWLPQRISNASETMGTLASAVVSLGYLFFVGRLTSVSFVVNAVTFERIGSVSQLVFSLPGVRAVPRRWPRVAAYFDLARSSDEARVPPETIA